MASHTEPAHRHTKDELMHPGRDHHLASAGPGERPCPDPSVHAHASDTKLQEQASTAALYPSPKKGTNPRQSILDSDNKLSSASAAASLKYAKPEDLPSFPVVGINTTSSAGAAANLANSNQKPFEHWKPDASSAAGKAAMLAKDYKMAPLWHPELSAAGSKAALLAHRDGGKLDLWMPTASAEGNSAAGLAMKNKGLSPQLDYGYTADGRKRALMAATDALGRSRSGSTPTPVAPAYPDSVNSAHNALNAATVAHRPSQKVKDSNRYESDAMQAARVQNLGKNVSREMFTEHPPVAIEVEEKKHNAALHASAISMAKQMYDYQEKRNREAAATPDYTGQTAAVRSHARGAANTATPDIKQQAMQYIHLQEAAQKLAAERLAKLNPDEASQYRSYYGYEGAAPRSRLSMRGRTHHRASSDGPTADSDDEMQAQRVRSQMSQFNSQLAQVDAKKRTTDRANLLAAAERKVHAQMANMDEKVFMETGKVSPAMMEEWEAKARARATADSEVRMQNHGKVHIGGGKFLDQSEINAIAASRIQPTLDEITETAEKRRARDEEIRLDQELKKQQAMSEKQREAENKAEQKRLKNEEKAAAKNARMEEKAAARIQKDAEKARKAEEKQIQNEDKRKSREVKREEVDAAKDVIPIGAVSETADVLPIEQPKAEAAMSPLDRHVSSVADSIASSSSSDIVTDPEHANVVVERVLSAPVVHESANECTTPLNVEEVTQSTIVAPIVVGPIKPVIESAEKAAATPKETPNSPTKAESKGIKSLFSRFKRRSHNAPASSSSTTEPKLSGEKSAVTSGRSLAAPTSNASAPQTSTVDTPTMATAAPRISSDAGSESSFKRHTANLHSVSSLSSSDDDNDNEGRQTRGRTGRRFGGFFASKGKTATTHKPDGSDDDDDDDNDEFEEARDTFDERLAPPPPLTATSAAEVKGSPVRETRFVEQL
ncbi:Eisosome assembly protein [Elasticomyces elasticus]|nr:Eisosome assembly protein [Elasticomyces elasticus]